MAKVTTKLELDPTGVVAILSRFIDLTVDYGIREEDTSEFIKLVCSTVGKPANRIKKEATDE